MHTPMILEVILIQKIFINGKLFCVFSCVRYSVIPALFIQHVANKGRTILCYTIK